MITTTPEEVLKRWVKQDDKPSLSDELLLTLIGDASVIMASTFSTLQERVDAEELSLQVIHMVIAAMVQRAYYDEISPRASFSYTSGPFSESGSYSSDASERQGLYLTNSEIALLRPKNTGKFGTISLTPELPPRGCVTFLPSSSWGRW